MRVLKLWLKKSLGTEILNRKEHRSCALKRAGRENVLTNNTK